MYNGVGLLTARGSGTSGHITRNLSNLRPRDDFRSANDARDMPVKHRAPDAAILDHERKRKVEVQCLELQDELEEKGLMAEEVEAQVDELRQRLLRQGQSRNAQPERGSIKEFQRHELLAAKAVDNARFSSALGIRKDYVEGESMNKEKQEELRIQRQMEKERRGEELAERKRQYEAGLEERQVQEAKQRAERAEAMEKRRLEVETRAKEREAKVKDIQRERESDGKARDTGRSAPRVRNDLVDSYRPGRDGQQGRRSRSPGPRGADRRDRSYSRSRSRSRSASPRSRKRRATSSVSRSPSPRRRRDRSYSSDSRSSRSISRSRSRSRSRSPPRTSIKGRATRLRTRSISTSRSPPRRRRAETRSRSRSPARKPLDRARSASRSPARGAGKKDDSPPRKTRQDSRSGSEDMDVQSD